MIILQNKPAPSKLSPTRKNQWKPLYISIVIVIVLHFVLINLLNYLSAKNKNLLFFQDVKIGNQEKNLPVSKLIKENAASSNKNVQIPQIKEDYKPPIDSPGLKKAKKFIEKGNFNKAENELQKLIEDNGNEWRAYVALGEICEKRGNLEGAVDYFRQAHEKQPGDTLPLGKLVSNTLLLDKPDVALKYFKDLEKIHYGNVFNAEMKAEIYLHRGAIKKQRGDKEWQADSKKAEEIINLIVKDYDNAEIFVSHGKLALLQDRRKDAIVSFEKALEAGKLAPEYEIDVLTSLYLLTAEQGDIEKSEQYINRLVEFMDNWKPMEFGRSLFVREYALLFKEIMLEKDVEADDIFTHRRYYRDLYRNKLQRREVEVDQTLYIMSEMVDMEWEASFSDILDEVNEYMSLAQGPDYPECYFNKVVNRPLRYMLGYIRFGDVYYRHGKYNKALEYYNKALELSPDNKLILQRIERLNI